MLSLDVQKVTTGLLTGQSTLVPALTKNCGSLYSVSVGVVYVSQEIVTFSLISIR